MANRQAKIEVGQRYEGFGRMWEVTRVYRGERVVDVMDVTDSHRRLRWPMHLFRNFRRST